MASASASDVLTASNKSPTIESNGSSKPTPQEEITFITSGTRKQSRRTKAEDDDEPLIDMTVALPKKSKKTERAQKRLQQKQQRVADRPKDTTLLDLPPELLENVLAFLRPSDIYRLLATNRTLNLFVHENANPIARNVIQRRYWILSRCFPLPVAFASVDSSAHAALLSERRQDMLQIHRKPYQHVKGVDERKVCTCLTCILAWNNLCLVLDMAHWQPLLDRREPLPMIQRGSTPEWNRNLLDVNAAIVEKAMNGDLLCYAMILEKHLRSTTSTLLRTYRGKKTIHPNRLYHITHTDAAKETDEFLERNGPPSYEFPWHRDNYYNLSAYVPNRKWSKEQSKWLYYSGDGLHTRDLQWLMDRFTPMDVTSQRLDNFVANFKDQAVVK